MRPIFLAAAIALAATPALAAAPIEGVWNTPTEHGQVEIYKCGEAFCGHVVTSDVIKSNPEQTDQRNHDAALRSRKLQGLVILNGFTGGPKEWKGGSVYNPEDGGTYHGSIVVQDPDTLKLTGCIIVPLCKSQIWRRVK